MQQSPFLAGVISDDDYFFAQLSERYSRYDRALFIETLDDWRFFGPASENSAWYTGKSWI